MSTTTCLIIMAACLILSAYFSATETAFSSANSTRLKTLAEKGSKKAKLACELLEHYDKLQFLEVRCDNEPAKRLYEKHGFCEVGRRRNYYTEPICDALIYKAEL